MRKKILSGIYLLFIITEIFQACKKDDNAPENPYDNIDRTITINQPTDPDPNTIAGLHKNIFFPKCANPGCHDGTFEPDYRTIESTFYTLVYQPVNLVTLDSAKIFTLRVIPHNTSDSYHSRRSVF